MSAMSGETTTVRPSRSKAGNWKQSDFPPPVGSRAKTSRPARASEIISACSGRKLSYPKCCFRVRSKGASCIGGVDREVGNDTKPAKARRCQNLSARAERKSEDARGGKVARALL